jgi:hypothetical protein
LRVPAGSCCGEELVERLKRLSPALAIDSTAEEMEPADELPPGSPPDDENLP